MEEVGVPDAIGDIIAIRQIQEEIKQSRLWRVDQASEGFGETLDQSVDAMKEEQGIQALDHLTKQFGGMARLESEQQVFGLPLIYRLTQFRREGCSRYWTSILRERTTI